MTTVTTKINDSYELHVDGLRAFAVMAVFLYHIDFGGPLGSWFATGFYGVDIFFVISGNHNTTRRIFVITLIVVT